MPYFFITYEPDPWPIHVLQLSCRSPGPVLYSTQGVYEAIGDLQDMSTDKEGYTACGPPLSVLQSKVIINSLVEYLTILIR